MSKFSTKERSRHLDYFWLFIEEIFTKNYNFIVKLNYGLGRVADKRSWQLKLL
jgi:hypothetical protein